MINMRIMGEGGGVISNECFWFPPYNNMTMIVLLCSCSSVHTSRIKLNSCEKHLANTNQQRNVTSRSSTEQSPISFSLGGWQWKGPFCHPTFWSMRFKSCGLLSPKNREENPKALKFDLVFLKYNSSSFF